ncbi:unnamed protein product, partial [Citrullus colocynthis]
PPLIVYKQNTSPKAGTCLGSPSFDRPTFLILQLLARCRSSLKACAHTSMLSGLL